MSNTTATASPAVDTNKLKIRKAELGDLDTVDQLFNEARKYMAAQGNSGQWVEGRPNAQSVKPNVEQGIAYVVTYEDKVVGFFVLSDDEPAYEQISDQWLYHEPYVVIHRFAAAPNYKVGSFVFNYLQANYPYIRLDTHRKNLTMQHLMDKFHFRYVGEVDYHYEPHDGIRICFEWHR